MADPLTLVQEYALGGKADQISVVGDSVHFGSQYVFPKRSFTAFKGQRDFASLELVLNVLRTKDMPHTDYLIQAKGANLEPLSFVDRRKLLDVLSGKAKIELREVPAAPAIVDGAEPASKRARLDGEVEAAPARQKFHRQLRDRNSMLVAKQEFKRVSEIANRAHMQLSSLLKQAQQQQAAAAAKAAAAAAKQKSAQQAGRPPGPVPVGAKPSGRFDRDTTTAQLQAFGGEAAGTLNNVINMYGAANPAPDAAAQQKAPPPPPPPSSSSQHRSSSQQAKPPSTSSGKGAAPSQPHKNQKPAGILAGATAAVAPQAPPDPLSGAMPIILVPSGMTAMVNMYNAEQLLGEGKLQLSATVAAQNNPKPTQVTFTRTMGKPPGKGVKYMVTDKPPDKKDTATWGRVVAVIVQGAKWQFKDWPFKGAAQGEMLETFSKVAGYYIHFADDKVPELVAGWNVKRVGLQREKRHMDAPVILDMWRHLDNFLAARKSPLAY